ncbi:RNA 2',3'-cyclic phosphodiesterase [Pseudomonas sp. Marseille-QA0892]
MPKRLFFGLPCPPDIAPLVEAHQSGVTQGRATPAADFHVTLAFLGCVPDIHLTALQRMCDELPLPSRFQIKFDMCRCWPGGLLHLAPSSPPDALIQLQATLAGRLQALGFTLDERPYAPHVTLARHASMRQPTRIPAISWSVCDIVLYESIRVTAPAARYQPLQTWRLESKA